MSGPLHERLHYELMQRIARFSGVRRAVMHLARQGPAGPLPSQPGDPVLARREGPALQQALAADGVAMGLDLAPDTVQAIRAWAEATPCYAYENPAHGFLPQDRLAAERSLGRPILKAVYLQADRQCPALRAVCDSARVHAVARAYLGPGAQLVQRQLWWTFPTQADEATRKKAAHFFHRDIDDWAFLKFFFYLTPVAPGDGAHHFVRGSHRPGWKQLTVEKLLKSRFTDAKVEAGYGRERMLEFAGPAGLGFAEDTFGLHKAQSPSHQPRLLLSLVFALHDYRLDPQPAQGTGMLVPAGAGSARAA